METKGTTERQFELFKRSLLHYFESFRLPALEKSIVHKNLKSKRNLVDIKAGPSPRFIFNKGYEGALADAIIDLEAYWLALRISFSSLQVLAEESADRIEVADQFWKNLFSLRSAHLYSICGHQCNHCPASGACIYENCRPMVNKPPQIHAESPFMQESTKAS